MFFFNLSKNHFGKWVETITLRKENNNISSLNEVYMYTNTSRGYLQNKRLTIYAKYGSTLQQSQCSTRIENSLGTSITSMDNSYLHKC